MMALVYYPHYYKKISGQIQGAKNYNVLQREKENWGQFEKFVEANVAIIAFVISMQIKPI